MPQKLQRPFPILAICLLAAVVYLAPIQAELGPPYLYHILLAGPLLFVPWGLILLKCSRPVEQLLWRRLLPFAGILPVVAHCLPSGYRAVVPAFLWLLFTLYLLRRIWRQRLAYSPAAIVAVVFLNVAAAWLVADRLGWRPLGFDPLIVLLTAIHFHFAGFALAVLTVLLPGEKLQRYLVYALLLGVGGVAIGITSTQLDGPAWVEMTAVTIMVIVGWSVAALQVRAAWQQPIWPRLLLILSSVALATGLLLALLYGWRFQHQWPWLTIPWMYATHGVLNSVGFALLGFLGWTLRE